MPSGEIITAIKHQVGPCREFEQTGVIQPLDHGLYAHIGIQGVQGIAPGFCLGAPQAGRIVQDLTLQIAEFDHIIINQRDLPDPGRRKIQCRRRPQAARADDQYPCSQQALLPLDTQFVEQDVARIPQEPGIVQMVFWHRMIGWHQGTLIIPSGVMR